ncbi:MAG TPA: autotransporter domain-containing protein [Xanthobacteraceae bacterium]|nr:autotransporter domain-containing protein [Xanthobacteraceae bacterium]
MHFRPIHFAPAGVLLIAALSLPLGVTPAAAQAFNQFIGFGDSTLDSGWYYTHPHDTNPTLQALYNASRALGGGIPTTVGGPMNAQVLASAFGLTAIPVGEPGGTNYAAGGASNIAYGNYTTLAPNTVSQVTSYLAGNGGAANPNALYMISSGGNDINQAICPGGVCAPNATQLAQASAADLAGAIAQLHAAGGRYFVVAINYGAAPGGNGASATAQTFRTYNQSLYADLAAADVNYIPVSGKIIADAVGSDPGLFGITNVQPGSTVTHQGGACVNPAPGSGSGGTIAAAWSPYCTTLVAPNAQQTFLFADNEHYSAAGQKIEADYAYSLIVAPSEISFLAEAPVVTRAAQVQSILNQIPVSRRQRAVGSYNAWISGGIASLSLANGDPGFPSDPGQPAMVTVGIDYLAAPDWLVGLAVSGGTTTQSFSLGGNFTQNEVALSAYAAWAGGPLWLDMIATYGGVHDDVNRVVPIGIARISNTGSTTGSNASFAAELGYDFTTVLQLAPSAALAVTHGPLAGVLLQRISVDGFAETDPFTNDGSNGFTALSYGSQLRNSAVSELGYQASTTVGRWHPFAKLVWNHEFASTDRLVTASVPEIAFAAPFSLPAVIFGKDWATATFGTTAMLGAGITAYASVSSALGQSDVVTYGGQLGLSVALDAPTRSAAMR